MFNRLCLIAVLALAGCGGGGGGASGGATSDGTSVSFSTSSISIDLIEGQASGGAAITATASGSASVAYSSTITGTGLNAIDVTATPGGRSASFQLTPAAGLAAGSYSGTVTLRACPTSACASQYPGSPFVVAYAIQVRRPLSAAPASLTLGAAPSSLGTAATAAIPLPSGSTNFSYTVSYPNGEAPWLKLTTLNGALAAYADASKLSSAGSYNAVVNIATADPAVGIALPVKLNVEAGFSVPHTISLVLGLDSQAQALQGVLPIAAPSGVDKTLPWTAASNDAWFKVDTTAGSFGGGMRWHADPSALHALLNGASTSAFVTISAGGGAVDVYTFEITKSLPLVRSLDTFALRPGVAGNVLVYGDGFDSLSNPAAIIGIPGVTLQAASVLAPHVLQMSLPALPAATYTVSFPQVAGNAQRVLTLRVIAPTEWAYQFFPNTGAKGAIVWDGVNRKLFVVNEGTGSILAYTNSVGFFSYSNETFLGQVASIGLTRNADALVMTRDGNTFYKMSPESFSTVATYAMDVAEPGTPNYARNRLAILGDNRVLTPYRRFMQLDTGDFAAFTPSNPDAAMAAYSVVSPDGRLMLVPGVEGAGPRLFDIAGENFRLVAVSAAPFASPHISSNHIGTRWSVGTSVFDAGLGLIGNAATTMPAGAIAMNAVLNRAGNRFYVLAATNEGQRVFAFDTTPAMPLLGSLLLANRVACNAAAASDGCDPFAASLAISDDDLTLFIAGDRGLAIQPVPANLR